MGIKKIMSGHGLQGSGQGHPENMGVTGPGGKFSGRKYPMDDDRTDITDKEEVGEVGSKKVPGNVGMKPHKTGGMSRKGAGGIGAFKATGTN